MDSRQLDLHELEQRRDSGSFYHRSITSAGDPSRRLFAWAPLLSFSQCWGWFIPPRIIFPTTAFPVVQGQNICRESPSFCWRVRLIPSFFLYHTNRTKIHKCHFSSRYTLVQVFSKFGKITSVDYLFHKSGPLKGKPRGYAFLKYTDEDVSPPLAFSLSILLCFLRCRKNSSAHWWICFSGLIAFMCSNGLLSMNCRHRRTVRRGSGDVMLGCPECASWSGALRNTSDPQWNVWFEIIMTDRAYFTRKLRKPCQWPMTSYSGAVRPSSHMPTTRPSTPPVAKAGERWWKSDDPQHSVSSRADHLGLWGMFTPTFK